MEKEEKIINETKKDKVGWRMRLIFILVGFTGQLAWNVENMYLNKFIFSFGATNYSLMITITVAVSAIVACLSTIFMGALSDKVRKRKMFIAFGYILWGLATASFGLISVENVQILFPTLTAATVASIFVIVIDAIMTFIGSLANDAAFNAYVTENVSDKNRGKVEGVLSILPLVAIMVIIVGLDSLTTNGHWDLFFYIIGGIAFIIGIISLFLIPKETIKETLPERKYLRSIADGFRIKTVKENKGLYLILLSYLVFGIATQIFFPYLIIYFQYSLGFEGLEFMICLGVVLVIGSILTVLVSILMDKLGRDRLLIPVMIVAIIGLVLVYFVGKGQLIFAIIAGIIMLFGYICGGSVLNAIVRAHVPEGQEGTFMGVRMIFAVTLPMVSGPYIAQVIVDNFATEQYENEYHTLQNLPPALIWIVAAAVLLLVFIPIFFYLRNEKKERLNRERTECGKTNNGISYEIKDEDKETHDDSYIPLNEHPNPLNKRNHFLVLNGYWDFKIAKEDVIPTEFDRKILVPYAPESPLSEVNEMILPDDILYYHKTIYLSEEMTKEHLFIHFLGVDQTCSLYVNGMLIMHNNSGYTGFSYDIRPLIKGDKKLEILLKVRDVSDTSYFSRGKQTLNRGQIRYTTTSGIYQPVYLESAPKDFIKSFKLFADYKTSSLKGVVETNIDGNISITIGDNVYNVEANKDFDIKIDNLHPWSVEDPYLYDVKLKFNEDEVSTYVGFRFIEVKKKNKKNRLFLNDKEIILKGLLDQGYYFGGNLTPKKYSDYFNEIKKIKELGFNTIRKHIKIEIPLFYYYCDKLGVLLIQDIVNGGGIYDKWTISSPLVLGSHKLDIDKDYKKFKREDEKGRKEYEDVLNYTLNLLNNSPSNIIITLFNEGWGQFDASYYYHYVKPKIDNKLIDSASGWYDTPNSDFNSKHIYFLPIKNYKQKDNRAYLLSEFGGYSLYLKDNFYGSKPYGYKQYKNSEKLTKGYKKLMKKLYKPLKKDMVGFIYTQVSDVEDEVNGLFTFDRKVLKIKEETIKEINRKIDSLIE